MASKDRIMCRIASMEKLTKNTVYSKHFAVNPFPELDDAKEYIGQQLDLMEHKPYLLLNDLSDIYVNWSADAKKYAAEHKEFNELCKVQATVLQSFPTRLVFNLYLSFFKPKSETKFFSTVEKAQEFLSEREKELFG